MTQARDRVGPVPRTVRVRLVVPRILARIHAIDCHENGPAVVLSWGLPKYNAAKDMERSWPIRSSGSDTAAFRGPPGLRWPDRRDGMLWAVEAERAEQDRLDMIEKVTREKTALREAGKLTGKPPFGFTVTGEKYDKRLIPSETGLKYVPVIYQHVIDGWSGKRIAAWLSEEGVLRENSPWWQNGIGS